jgi:hypothetical protein
MSIIYKINFGMSVVQKKICEGISSTTGKPCSKFAVGPNTLKKGTREFLDPRFCQMHQPGMESKRRCVCPYCVYHRSRDKYRKDRELEMEASNRKIEEVNLLARLDGDEVENAYGVRRKRVKN